MRIRKLMYALTGVLMLAAFSSAHASHVCFVSYIPSNSTLGSEGYLYVGLYSDVACAGTFEGGMYLCSVGATSASCPSSSSFHYTKDALIGHMQAAANAADTGQRVLKSSTTCNGGGSGCTPYLWYYGN